MAMTKEYKLINPIVIGNDSTDKIIFSKPKLGKLRKNPVGLTENSGVYDQLANIIAATGDLPLPLIDELSFEDVQALGDFITDFLGLKPLES